MLELPLLLVALLELPLLLVPLLLVELLLLMLLAVVALLWPLPHLVLHRRLLVCPHLETTWPDSGARPRAR